MEASNGSTNVTGRGMDGGAVGGQRRGKEANKRSIVKFLELGLRLLAWVLTLAAAVILGVDKQFAVVPIVVVPTLPPMDIGVTAKWHYLSAFVYFVVVNAIACAYASISLLFTCTIAKRAGMKGLKMMITIVDTVMVALLFSGVGAASAVGLIGIQGNSHVQWKKVCHVLDKFCDQAAIAIFISLAGSILFFLLVCLANLKLHKKH